MRRSAIRAAIIGAVLVMGATGAHAFQIVPGETNADGSAKFVDPDQARHRFSDPSQTGGNTSGVRIGNTTLQFGSTSDAQYGPSPFIRDQFLDNPSARTVPSQWR